MSSFDFQGHPIRIVMIDNKPWLVAKDICDAIGIIQASVAVKRVDSRDVTTVNALSAGGNQNMLAVNESGMYDLVFQSRKPAAKEFRRWVTNEILPQIRETGMYLPGIDLPTALERWAAALREKDEASKRAIEAEAKIEELKPVVTEWRAYMNSSGTCDLGALAQALGGGRTRLISRLRELGILVSKEASQDGVRPKQPYSEQERGWFVVRMENTNIGPKYVTYATPKGVSEVLKALVKHGVGEHRWGALPTEEDLIKKIVFEEDTLLRPLSE